MPAPQHQQSAPWGRIALVWLIFAGLMVLLNFRNIAESRFPDPDDTLRLVQVRDLLAGQGWFDLHQYRINPGDSPVMHWSRLVDLPLALSILLLKPLLGQALAEHVTVVLVPPVTLGAILAVIGRMACRLFDRKIAVFACLASGFMPVLLTQLQPLRIDHHGWQIFTVILALGALMHRRSWAGGALAGAAFAAGLSISLEVLPLAAAFGAVLLLRWLCDPVQRWGLPAFLASLAGALILLFALTRGFGDLTQYCDAVSPAYLAFFGLVALASAAIAAIPALPRPAIVGLLGLAGAGGLALFVAMAPQCTSGPFGNLEPLVRDYWYVNVLEGQPFWAQRLGLAIPMVVQGFLALAITIHLWRTAEGERRAWWLDYLLIFAAALLGGLLVWRSMAFAGVMSALPIGWLLNRLLTRYRAALTPLARFGVALAALLVLLPATPLVLARLVLPASVSLPAQAIDTDSSCDTRNSAAVLGRLPPATILAPVDIGPALLERTQHRVIATAHHRAHRAMNDVILTFVSPDEQAHAIVARHHAEYVAICTGLPEAQLYAMKAPGGLMAHLLENKAPVWLEEVPLDAPKTFRVWKVIR